MSKKKKKVEKEIEVKAEEKPPEVEKQISSENLEIQIQECPADACQELQDVWASGKGCYNSNSNYCKSCGTDFPATKEICEKRSIEVQTKVVEKKSTPRISSVTKEGFGHRAGTQAAGIDAILQEGGGTPVQFVALLKERGYNTRNITDDDLWRRTLTHMSDLKRNHGIKIAKVNGVYAIVA